MSSVSGSSARRSDSTAAALLDVAGPTMAEVISLATRRRLDVTPALPAEPARLTLAPTATSAATRSDTHHDDLTIADSGTPPLGWADTDLDVMCDDADLGWALRLGADSVSYRAARAVSDATAVALGLTLREFLT